MEYQIIDYLFDLVCSNVYASNNEILVRALKNRFIGFRAELEFQNFCLKRNIKLFEGGYILPLRDGQKTLTAPIYFTIDNKPDATYRELYSILNNSKFSKLIYIKYDSEVGFYDWKATSVVGINSNLPVPKFKIYDFQRNDFFEIGEDINLFLNYFTEKKKPFKQELKVDRNKADEIKGYLEKFTDENLINLYVSRLIFDGYIGFKYFKGIPSDIDGISKGQNGKFIFHEIKEKDLSKTNPIGFGIDIQRLNDCLSISRGLDVRYLYIVRHVNNQAERDFLSWRYIDFEDFNKYTDKNIIKEGGTGMNTIVTGSGRDNPTLLVEEKHFKKI